MSFRQPDSPVFESDACYALHFPPLTFAIILPKSLDIANPGAHGDSLDNCYLADDLEIHLGILASLAMPSLSRVTQLWIDTAREFGDPIPKPKGHPAFNPNLPFLVLVFPPRPLRPPW